MLFNSYIFVFGFLPVTFLVFLVLARYARPRAALGWLVVASLFFYGWWNPRYLALIFLSMAFNFSCGQLLTSRWRSRTILTLGVAVNLGVDPRKSDQVVRGATVLPRGTGKDVRVCVFAQGAAADEATAAGAELALSRAVAAQPDSCAVIAAQLSDLLDRGRVSEARPLARRAVACDARDSVLFSMAMRAHDWEGAGAEIERMASLLRPQRVRQLRLALARASGDAESEESITEDGFLRTGDRGEIDEQGRLKITGRTKELFKTSKGKYVAPVPIPHGHPATDSAEREAITR